MSETRCESTIHEPSVWLRGATAERVRQIDRLHVDPSAVVVAAVGRIGEPGSREDRECDRCGTYVPPGDELHVFTYQPTERIVFCGGLCTDCARKECPR